MTITMNKVVKPIDSKVDTIEEPISNQNTDTGIEQSSYSKSEVFYDKKQDNIDSKIMDSKNNSQKSKNETIQNKQHSLQKRIEEIDNNITELENKIINLRQERTDLCKKLSIDISTTNILLRDVNKTHSELFTKIFNTKK